jgi:chromosome segregation ATPase
MKTKTSSSATGWWDSIKAGFKSRVDNDARAVADAQSVVNDAVIAKVEGLDPNHSGENILDALDELGLNPADIERLANERIETNRLLQLATVEKAEATRELTQVRAELAELQRDHAEAEKQFRRDVGRLTSRKDQLLSKLGECSEAEKTIKASAPSTAKSNYQSAADAVGDCKFRISNAESALKESRRQVEHWQSQLSRFNGSFQHDSRADDVRTELQRWTDESKRLEKELQSLPAELADLDQAAKDADRALVESFR